jgi:hypothetical protein
MLLSIVKWPILMNNFVSSGFDPYPDQQQGWTPRLLFYNQVRKWNLLMKYLMMLKQKHAKYRDQSVIKIGWLPETFE